jgi:hypothetical protein
MPKELSINTWKKTYSSNFSLIDVSDLSKAPFTDCHPPLTRVPRGRPKKERFRKDKIRGPRGVAAAQAMAEPAGDDGDEVWSPYHCSTCGGRGHFLLLAGDHTSKGSEGIVLMIYKLRFLTVFSIIASCGVITLISWY